MYTISYTDKNGRERIVKMYDYHKVRDMGKCDYSVAFPDRINVLSALQSLAKIENSKGYYVERPYSKRRARLVKMYLAMK